MVIVIKKKGEIMVCKTVAVNKNLNSILLSALIIEIGFIC